MSDPRSAQSVSPKPNANILSVWPPRFVNEILFNSEVVIATSIIILNASYFARFAKINGNIFATSIKMTEN